MKLFTTARAPNPRRVEIFLAEKSIAVPSVNVDIGRREHKDDAYRSINPLQRMPALQFDDGTVLTESIAICRYFEELHPDPPLFGATARERAEVEMWQRQMELDFLFPVAAVFRHTHPFMKGLEVPQIADYAAACRPRILAFLDYLDTVLANRRFAAGDAFSVADITGLVTVEFMRPARIDMPAHLGHVARWAAEIAARPGAKR